MPLVHAKCTNCGANLEVDSSKHAAICQYWGSAFIVEKAINNYNITNHNNINAEVVNIYGGNSADFVIRAGTLKKYNGASTVVVIPNSVTSIGVKAFDGCIGLTSVTIPDSVTSIGERAFYGCSSLTNITVNENNKSYSSADGVLFNKDKTELMQYAIGNTRTSYTIPNSVTSIGYHAFEGCNSLTSVTIGNSMTIIGYHAFEGCNSLTSVTIPDSVTSICEDAFKDCSSLTKVTLPQGMSDRAFQYTPWWRWREQQRRQSGVCTYCGGTFKGIFLQKCSKCGKPKNY